MRKTIAGLFLALFALAALAQPYETGSVLKWESKPYSQSAHIIRDHIVYWVQVGDSNLQIARRSDKAEMSVGQEIKCRVEKGHMFVTNKKGKDIEYDIIGSE